MTRSLDGPGEYPLVFGAVACNAARDDFPFFGQEFAQPFDVLIINKGDFFTAKSTELFSEETSPARRSLLRTSGRIAFFSHPQNGTSSSGESSSLEISIGPSFF